MPAEETKRVLKKKNYNGSGNASLKYAWTSDRTYIHDAKEKLFFEKRIKTEIECAAKWQREADERELAKRLSNIPSVPSGHTTRPSSAYSTRTDIKNNMLPSKTSSPIDVAQLAVPTMSSSYSTRTNSKKDVRKTKTSSPVNDMQVPVMLPSRQSTRPSSSYSTRTNSKNDVRKTKTSSPVNDMQVPMMLPSRQSTRPSSSYSAQSLTRSKQCTRPKSKSEMRRQSKTSSAATAKSRNILSEAPGEFESLEQEYEDAMKFVKHVHRSLYASTPGQRKNKHTCSSTARTRTPKSRAPPRSASARSLSARNTRSDGRKRPGDRYAGRPQSGRANSAAIPEVLSLQMQSYNRRFKSKHITKKAKPRKGWNAF